MPSGALMADFDWEAHYRSGLHLGDDNYASLEYRLPDGRVVSYPAGEVPPTGVLIGLSEHHKKPDGSWCGGWVGFKNVPEADEHALHELVSADPLTVAPSLLCRVCGNHGFIRSGKWEGC